MRSRRDPDSNSESTPGSSLQTRSSGALRLSGADIDRLLESLEQPAALCTVDARVMLVNPAFERVYSSALDPELPLVSSAAARDALRAGHIWYGASVLSGTVTLVPLRSADGEVGACLALLADTQKELETARLRGQLEQLRRTESLGQLASGIAHDFNNMLAVILNYVKLAERRLASGAAAVDALHHIRDAAERSAGITQQLLALSRGPAGDVASVDVNASISSLEAVLRGMLGEQIQYRVELDEQLWRARLGSAQLQRILLNLAANSRDAMPDGGTFSVRTANAQIDASLADEHEDLSPGRYVQIEIGDTGPGMPSDVADHIFEPFFTTKEVGVGTGLGLSIIEGIIKQAGGHISVSSRMGAGTTFTVYLLADAVRATQPSPSAEGGAGQRTILVVDDEGPLRRAVARMLADSGYLVLQAADGLDAVELLEERKEPVDLVLTDVLMPRMSGVELVKLLADQYPSVEAVLMSGYTHGLISKGGLEPASLLFLQKPFSKDELLEKVELAWGRAAAAERS